VRSKCPAVCFAYRLTVAASLLFVFGVVAAGLHPERGGVFIVEIVMFLALYGSRVFIIAVKYGYMPLCDYNTVLSGTAKDAEVTQLRHQLITGWINPSEATLHLELMDAAARHRIDLNQHSVKIPKQV
jgi:hypothetical protein